MRIGTNELEKDLVKKITKFDELELNYSEEDGSIVMYDGNTFYTGDIEIDDVELPYFTDDLLARYKKHLYYSEDNFISSFDTVMTNNIFASSFKNMLCEIKPTFICKADSSVLFMKEYGAYYYVYTVSGKLYKINKENPSTQTVVDICGLIKSHFPCPNLNTRMVRDIIVYNEGFIITVYGQGVYYISIANEIYELKFNFPRADKMALLANDNIVFTMEEHEDSLCICNMKTGKKVETYNYLSLMNQTAKYIKVLKNKDFVILGHSNGLHTYKMLHYWKLDEAGVYNNIDYMLPKNRESIYYQPKFIDELDGYLVIAGTIKGKIFIWRLNLTTLEYEPEILFDKVKILYDDLHCIHVDNDFMYIVERDYVHKYDLVKQEIVENNKFAQFNTTDQVFYLNEKFICIDKKDVVAYLPQKYSYFPDIRIKVLTDEDTPCNKVNIYVASTTGKERIVFYNPKTVEQVVPDFYALTKNNESIISLKNIKDSCLEMDIVCEKDSEIKGIIIHKNNEYFNE